MPFIVSWFFKWLLFKRFILQLCKSSLFINLLFPLLVLFRLAVSLKLNLILCHLQLSIIVLLLFLEVVFISITLLGNGYQTLEVIEWFCLFLHFFLWLFLLLYIFRLVSNLTIDWFLLVFGFAFCRFDGLLLILDNLLLVFFLLGYFYITFSFNSSLFHHWCSRLF